MAIVLNISGLLELRVEQVFFTELQSRYDGIDIVMTPLWWQI